MKCFKKIILFLACFATVFSFAVLPASAEWNENVGYYGSIPFRALLEKQEHENRFLDEEHKLEVKWDDDNQCYRLQYLDTGAWYLNEEGTYPYTIAEGDIVDSVNNPLIESVNGWWLPGELSSSVVVLSYDTLDKACLALSQGGHDCRLVRTLKFGVYYWVIQDFSTDGGANRIYGNSSAMAYVADGEDSAKDIQYDYIVNDNSTTDNSITVQDNQIIDIEGGTLNLINDLGVTVPLTIESLTFDTGNKTYTVNAYNTTNEGDEYYYTYYTYNISYNITNTYITYIGSNDAYEKEEYEFYYQLPDGRSSADLTADEIAGMSFEFADIVNYQRSATDISVRALYHFDGNTEDSSYFSTQGSFAWNSGASITYMEAPEAFDGALYLDSTAHTFDITLPSSMAKSDYTIQFRYYQASEPDTQDNIDNYLKIGGIGTLFWDEKTVSRDPDGVHATWALPIGTWNEIAVVRNDDHLYVYLNGVCVSSEGSYILPWNNTISFHFGSGSRAYSMLDELRVLNFALATGGASYTPTAVPHDSNLVLVLPDQDRPLADEYYEVISSRTNLFGNIHNYLNGGTTSHFHGVGYRDGYPSQSLITEAFPEFSYRDLGAFHVSASSDCVMLSRNGTDSANPSGDWDLYYWGFAVPVVPDSSNGLVLGRYYTFSLVHVDGTVDSFTFLLNGSTSGIPIASAGFSWGSINYMRVLRRGQQVHSIAITPNAGSTVDIAYIELVEGTSTDVHFEKKTAVYPGDSVPPNTAAIQSTIPVNGYTVGGVRPTLPARGDCWFPVQENRIQACYIYTGSMWEEVGCRWYTGSRWIPIYAFDLTTLEDLFDIADAADAIVPIISESGFWRWWQLQWLDFREYLDGKFDELIAAINGRPSGSDSDCIHEYSSEITTDPGCVEPGYQTYTCSECGHQYTELIDAHGHDWIVTGSVPAVLDDEGNVLEEGYDELTCSVCDTKARDYGDGPEEQDLFDALGDFIADGITWLLDKLTELVDSLKGITDTFNSFVEKIKVMAGDYPAFFGAFMLLIPEELATLMWFALVAFVVVAVWKKWSK